MWFAQFREQKRWLNNLDQDILDHIESEVQDNLERGMTSEQAHREALRKFGNVALIQEDTRAVWKAMWLVHMMQDVRFGLRTLRRQPAFTAMVVASLALGIGMNAAVFSVLNSVLFQPIPYPSADLLIWLANYNQEWNRDNWVGRTDYLSWKEQAQSFEKMTAYGTQDLALVTGSEASQERIGSITGDFWAITGARSARGRLFDSREVNAIVLSWRLFERRFGADVSVIGRVVRVNGWPFTVTGVLPKEFQFFFPQQVASGDEVREIDAYIPIPEPLLALPPSGLAHWDAETRRLGPAPFWICVIGRLKPAAPVETAHAEMKTIYNRVAEQDPGPLRRSRVLQFTGLQAKLASEVRRPLVILWGAVGFVLLIACVNIANLLLAQASTRQREIAIRTAIGASRNRVMRQFLTESAVLTMLGCATGLLLANWAIDAMIRFAPHALPRLTETSIDGRVLTFTLVISVIAGLSFGMIPAIAVWKGAIAETLKTETGTSSAAGGKQRLRRWLVASEFALAIVLLAGAGLMLKSLWRMNARPPGFAPEKILVMRITLSGPQYSTWPPKQAYTERLLNTLSDVNGVDAVGVDTGGLNTTVHVNNARAAAPGEGVFASIRGISYDYLRAMGVPLVKGDWPKRGDLSGVMVNEAFARQINIADPTGTHIGGSILNDTVVGVVADAKVWQLDSEALPEVYMPYQRLPLSRSMRVAVRVSRDADSLKAAIRSAVSDTDRTQPLYDFRTLDEALYASIAPRQFSLFLLGIFAVTAVLLALTGIYGVIAYTVALRTREIGIRIAVGAHRSMILGMIMRQAMSLAFAGIAAGMVAASGLTRFMGSLLYGVQPNDVWTFAAAACAMSATALIAAAAPAIRAARVDPLVALRCE